MSPDIRRTRGSLGEQIAADHLTGAGYEILDRNWRVREGELDLVAADADAIVFCEVKTRVAGGRSGPELALDAVGPAKRRRLRHLAMAWLRDRRAAGGMPHREHLRFDAIGITISPGGRLLSLDHVTDAF
ncbi:MAG TPA: YraN family protein [Thermoleophilaceae bacterium]|jgi:putative endonuclease